STATKTTGPSFFINNIDDFPALPSSSQRPFNWMQSDMFDELINILSSKMEKTIEATTRRLFKALDQRICKIEKTIKGAEAMIDSDITVSSSDSSSESDNDLLMVIAAQAKQQRQRTLSLPSSEKQTLTKKPTTRTQPTTTTSEIIIKPPKKKKAT
ncbi:unnamed protein product, partial [Rotaria sp. Silwood2]